jgi:Prokaryotic E2 family E
MTPFERHLEDLQKVCPGTTATRLQSGAHLITIPNYDLPAGWNRSRVTILFVAPPAYPAAQPDCFWAEPVGMRLANGTTPQGTNDSNPIPELGPRGTWFSWHLQHWNPNRDSLLSYFKVIEQRFKALR